VVGWLLDTLLLPFWLSWPALMKLLKSLTVAFGSVESHFVTDYARPTVGLGQKFRQRRSLSLPWIPLFERSTCTPEECRDGRRFRLSTLLNRYVREVF